jgi:hypothetical protein
MENKHIITIGGFGLLILLMVLLVFQSVKTPKMGEDLTGLNLNKTPAASPAPVVKELLVKDMTVGSSSASVVAGDTITVHYLGGFTDGKVFDNSYQRNTPLSFQVGGGQVIQGIDQGVVGMKIGGKRQLVIPSDLAYGPTGQGDVIPPNTPLIFELELLDIKSAEAPSPSSDPTLSPVESPTPNP